ncbi:MAG: hydroxymethylpyrimidine/phosphomethylpyrimidine kinase [Bacteroidetes bacterium]|nr:hydroxymethylpyrimidine/phosphomethylpyrimidine kinase [Bacteroidota bacterium]
MKARPTVLSIAGFDPSGGAGVLADIKTFEQHKVQGMGVVTGLTFQNDSEFDGVKWISEDEIIKQIEVLARKYKFEFVKIGMIQSLDILEKIISKLTTNDSRLLWDPIIRTSSGFDIHQNFEKEKLTSTLKNIYLLTPNTDEIKILSGAQDEMKGAKELSKYCNVFLKGGHSEKKKGHDYLFTTEGKIFPFRTKKISEIGKHGSGCVLSSAITANLANGNDLQRSCLKGKDYVTKFLMSNKTLIGYHKI